MTTIQRIAILSLHTSPLAPMGGKKTGGMNVYIREMAEEMNRRGVMVDIFTRRTSPLEPRIDHRLGENVRVIYLTAGPVEMLDPDEIYPYVSEFTSRLMAFAMMQNLQYDLVYSHYWLSGWVGAKLKESWGIPFVQMFHTLGQMKQRILTHETVMLNERIRTEMDVVQQADAIISATEAERDQLLWLYRAPRQRIAIVPPGVDLARFHLGDRASALEALGYPHDTRILLFVGRIEALKGIDLIVEAVRRLHVENIVDLAKTRLVIVGGNLASRTDAELNALRALVHEHGLDDIIEFVGAKERDELGVYYHAATAVLMPSDYESFGMVALEAMASGTPVIASEVGGLAYLIESGETGYHIPVRDVGALMDRIRQVLQNPASNARVGKQAAQRACMYAWPRITDQLFAVFASVMAARQEQAAS